MSLKSNEWFEELSESETPYVSDYLTLVAPIAPIQNPITTGTQSKTFS